MWENLPFLLLNGGIGLAVIYLANRGLEYLRERDKSAAQTEQTQTTAYTAIINNQSGLIQELRASSERRETEYQKHNQQIATALAGLGDTQASQVSVLRELHQANDRMEKTQRVTLDGVNATSANVTEVRTAVDHVLEQIQAAIDTFTTALSAHDDNAQARNDMLVRSISNSNELGSALREAVGRIEDTLDQLREMVHPKNLMYGIGVEEAEKPAETPETPEIVN